MTEFLIQLSLAITIVVAARQVIGIKGIGITAPVLIGFAFGAIGIQAGTIAFFGAIALTFAIRYLMRNIRLLTLPKIALTLLFVILGMLFLIPLFAKNTAAASTRLGETGPGTVFAFLILILSMEQFAVLLMERGPRKTFRIALETFFVSSLVFFALHWLWLKNFTLSYPLFVLAAAIFINIVLGKWTGLRMTEYMRFKDLLFK